MSTPDWNVYKKTLSKKSALFVARCTGYAMMVLSPAIAVGIMVSNDSDIFGGWMSGWTFMKSVSYAVMLLSICIIGFIVSNMSIVHGNKITKAIQDFEDSWNTLGNAVKEEN